MLFAIIEFLTATLLGSIFRLVSQLLIAFLLFLVLVIIHRFHTTLFPCHFASYSQLVVWLFQWLWHGNATSPARGLNTVATSQTVLITGATSGIGLALAKHLHQVGFSLICTYINPDESGYQQLQQLRNSCVPDQQLHLVKLDVRSEQSISAASIECQRLLDSHGHNLHALVNNAGLGSLQPFAWLQRTTIRNMIETNLLGNLLVAREFLPLLVQSKGRLVFVSSGLGIVPGATYATYGVTKCSQIFLARCLNMELAQTYGVRSIAIVPHNFIKNTSICADNVASNQLAWDELNPLERQLYAGEFERQVQLARSLESATQRLRKKQPTSKQPRARADDGAPVIVRWAKEAAELAQRVAACLRGENLAGSLEDSGALQCFEAALRLENPPEIMFAGDSIYQLLIGSLLVAMPSCLMGLLGGSVAPNLYK